MSSSPSHGLFVWHELMTSDPAAAPAFYAAVVGWKTQSWDQDSSYTLWMNGEAPLGGLMALPEEVKAMNVPPNWLSYVGVADVDAAAGQAESLGGKVLKAPQDIPGAGRFAVIADPQGAVFCLYASGVESPGYTAPALGEFSWHELGTTDPAGALRFYGSMFGWEKMDEVDMGAEGKYLIYGLGGHMLGGIFPKPAQAPVSYWLPYARVASADTAATAAAAAGGTVILPPMEVPGGDRIAVMTDPQGAFFAVHSVKV